MVSLDKLKKIEYRYKNTVFYITLTCIFAILIVNFSLVSQINKSKANLNLTLAKFNELSNITLFADASITNNEMNLLETDLKKDLQPINSFLNTSSIVDSSILEVKNLAIEWLDLTRPLLKYKLTDKGFTNTQNNQYFTTDLEYFIDSSQSLRLKTQNLYSKYSVYKFFISLFSDKAALFFSRLDDLLEITQFLYSYKIEILAALGHYSTQRYVIFTQNTGEARPNGGFTGSYIPINVFQGRVSIGDSQSIYYASGGMQKKSLAHPATWYYSYLDRDYGVNSLHNSNFFSCFDDSARLLEKDFSSSKNGYSIDSLIMINSTIIQKLLPNNFSLVINDSLTINSDNLLEQIERITSFEASNKDNPKSEISEIIKKILENINTIFKSTGSTTFALKIMDLLTSRDIQVWFKDSGVQKVFTQTRLSPNKNCANYNHNDFITPLIANLSGDKRNLITENQFNIYYEKVLGGYKINLKYKQILPDKINLQRGFQRFVPLTFVGLQLPVNAYDLHVDSPQALQKPFLNQEYNQFFKSKFGQDIVVQDEIRNVISSSRDLNGGKLGFSYVQPDNTAVLGIYIVDDPKQSEVNFSFIVPKLANDELTFFGQPGLNKPLISLGKKMEFVDYNTNILTNSDQISQGLTIKIY